MAKIKGWKSKVRIEQGKQEQELLRQQRERFKGKAVEQLSQKERNELLEQIAKDLGYL